METTPQVSAVIPTRNRPTLVIRAVESVLAQTFENLEAIVVIDGPDESTEEALAAIADPRLRVITLDENVGGAEARNLAIRAARGQWIALLDDDDVWLPEKTELQLNCAKMIAAPFAVVSSRLIGRTSNREVVFPRHLYCAHESVSEYLFCRKGFSSEEGMIQTSSVFASRELFLLQPFRRGLKRHQDWDWILRVGSRHDVQFQMLPQALSVFDMGGDRSSISRVPDWEFSMDWIESVRPLISIRAYSHFLSNFCTCSASAAGAPAATYRKLLLRLMCNGQLSFGVLWRFALYSLVPAEVRRRMRAVPLAGPTSEGQ